MVGVAVGSTAMSSSENSGSEPSNPYCGAFPDGRSGSDDLLELGSSSHIAGGELPASTVDDLSHPSPIEKSRGLVGVPWLNVGDEYVDEDGPM